MGLAASQGRLLMLTARKSDIEFQVQLINQRRTVLAEQSSRLARGFANAMYQNDDPMVLNNNQGTGALLGFIDPVDGVNVPQTATPSGWYESEMTVVQALDKELELREKTLDTQHKEVETEYDAVKKVIDKNIETSFKTLG